MINLKTQTWLIENVETVLFDKDGTFVDLHYFWGRMTELRVEEIIKVFELPEDCFEKLCYCLGYNCKTSKMYPDGITALYSRSKIIEIFKKDLENLGVNTTTKDLEDIFNSVSSKFYEKMIDYTRPIEPAIEFIKKLYSNGIKLGIVTSDSVESTNLTLKHFGWEYLFASVIGRESSSYTKESGYPTQMALKKLCANPKTTVMIGDAPMDYISAKNAGIDKVILVSSGQIKIEQLMEISDFTASTLDEIHISK
ncbi:HAD family hydrolase [bacterium]|nr:HAD family hydrolase [bacterium]